MARAVENIAVHAPVWLVGGVERMLSLLLPEWGRTRRVVLAHPRSCLPGLAVPPGVDRLEAPRRAAARLRFWDRMIAERGVDTVVLNSYEDVIPDLLHLRAGGVRCVRIHHGAFEVAAASRPLALWREQSRLLALADRTVSPNSFDASALAQAGFAGACRIPNPVPDDYNPEGRATPKSDPVVLYVGRLAAEKGVAELVACFAEVARQVPDARLWLTAAPTGLSVGDVRRLIRRAGLDGRVELKPAGDPRAYYRRASVLVLPSPREGFGMVIVEAKKFGLPVVMFDLVNGEAVEHGRDGLLAPTGDYAALARRLVALLGDGELRRRLGERALASSAAYNLSTVAGQWETLFAGLADGQWSGPPAALAPRAPADPRDVAAALARAQDEYARSFYPFLHRHPAVNALSRAAREALPYGSLPARCLRKIWFKACVPLIRPRRQERS